MALSLSFSVSKMKVWDLAGAKDPPWTDIQGGRAVQLLWTQVLDSARPHRVTLDESFDLSLTLPGLGFLGFF